MWTYPKILGVFSLPTEYDEVEFPPFLLGESRHLNPETVNRRIKRRPFTVACNEYVTEKNIPIYSVSQLDSDIGAFIPFL